MRNGRLKLRARVALLGSAIVFSCFAVGDANAASGTVPVRAKCATGDANVFINPTTKRYVVNNSANAAIIKQHAAFDTVQAACLSQAKRMGAQLMSTAQLKRMGHP